MTFTVFKILPNDLVFLKPQWNNINHVQNEWAKYFDKLQWRLAQTCAYKSSKSHTTWPTDLVFLKPPWNNINFVQNIEWIKYFDNL